MWFDGKARAERREDGDTVKRVPDTVIRALERPVDTVIAHLNMHFSLSIHCREPSSPAIAANERSKVPSKLTVDLSVSSRSSAGAGPGLPMSGTSLLTIEWE